ncbi:MAG: tRNA (adenine(22)-N(1))-methyltransferase TrmK, partial [Acholeplasmatales bacterium]|nr:tRNA (adenine(22)-N(1))-methyltransferase TrmK [Acholeplasmatales bacterium]
EIIVAQKGKASYDSLDIKFGPILRRKKPEAFITYYEKQKMNLFDMIQKITTEEVKNEKIQYFRDILEVLCEGVSMKTYIKDSINYYTTYFLDDEPRPTIFISAGGGYLYSSPRETAPVASVFNKLGYHVVAVNYREDKTLAYPIPNQHYAYGVNQFRNDKRVSKFIGLGFSAGGHNLLEVALHEDEYNCHFDLIMLAYPVITSNPSYWHEGSYKNLLLENFGDEKLHKRLSLELEVHKNAPDLFLWGTFTDESVNVMNSILLLEAYKKNDCNCEYHCYPLGGHGLSVADEASAEGNPAKVNPYIQNWVYLADKWIKEKL